MLPGSGEEAEGLELPTAPVGMLYDQACLESSVVTSFTARCASHNRAHPTPRDLPITNEHPLSPKSPVTDYIDYVFKITYTKKPRNNANALQLKSE